MNTQDNNNTQDADGQALPAPVGSLFDSPEWKACRDTIQQSDEERIERMKRHPDNGKSGWWIVDGIRHHAYAHASSAIEAIEKADKAGIVQDWEFPEARFWTEKLPDVF
jgi:hypothetical protein